MPQLLAGYNAVVTGAGSGMGAAAARRLALEGARVVISDIDYSSAVAVANEIDGTGARAIGVRCNVAVASECGALVTTAEHFFGGPIDTFLANAGVSYAGDFLTAEPEQLRRIIEVNVIGSVFSAQAALASLLKSSRATLVFTSSISGVTGRAKRSVYNASKHALTGLVKSLALEFGPWGVRVNAIAPGPTDTPFLRTHLAKVNTDVDAAIGALVRSLPLGHLVSTEDFADAVIYLVSPQSRSVTGHTLLLDCGAAAGKM
jgi:NAD(P)-dependent dehydrogenase (short-subunit alcohol dehydrogenase family)